MSNINNRQKTLYSISWNRNLLLRANCTPKLKPIRAWKYPFNWFIWAHNMRKLKNYNVMIFTKCEFVTRLYCLQKLWRNSMKRSLFWASFYYDNRGHILKACWQRCRTYSWDDEIIDGKLFMVIRSIDVISTFNKLLVA